jgi:hypothetical protein
MHETVALHRSEARKLSHSFPRDDPQDNVMTCSNGNSSPLFALGVGLSYGRESYGRERKIPGREREGEAAQADAPRESAA